LFDTIGEMVVVGLSMVTAWVVAWAVAEKRTTRILTAGHEAESGRDRRRIAQLEAQMSQGDRDQVRHRDKAGTPVS